MIARRLYRPLILLGGITTRTNVRFSSDRAGKDANTQQSIKTIPKQQIGKKNVNDRGQEVYHTEKFAKSSLASPQPNETLSQEQFEKITAEKNSKRQKEFKFKKQSKEKDNKLAEITIQTQKKSNKIGIGGLFAAVIMAYLTYNSQKLQQEMKKLQQDSHKIQKQKREQQIKTSPQTLRKERIKKYAEQNLGITLFENQIYSKKSENSTYKQLKLIVDDENPDGLSQLHVVTGLPGNGKTTQLKRIVKDLRMQGHIVYFVNLRDDKVGEKTAEEALSEAEEAMSQFLKTELEPTKKQKAFLFIDDINVLETLQNRNEYQCWMKLRNFWFRMATVHRCYNFKTVVISSSSTYMDKLKSKSYVEKASMFHIIANKTTEQMKQSIENIFDFYLKEKNAQYSNAKRYLLDQGYSLREVMKIVYKFKLATTEENFLKELQTDEESIIQEKKEKIFQQLLPTLQKRTKIQQKYDQGLLAEIIKLKQFDGTNGCLQVKKPFQQQAIKQLKIQNVTGLYNYLEQEDLLFFCFPRSEIKRRIVQGLLDRMKKMKEPEE